MVTSTLVDFGAHTIDTERTTANDRRVDSVVYIDGNGRARETQAYSPTSGKLIVGAAMTDDRANTYRAIDPFAISHTTPGDYTSPANGLNGFATWPTTPAVDYRLTVSAFDTVNRATNVTVKWKPGAGGSQDLVSTNTIFEGVRTVVDPQIGASAATTVDALGRTVSTEVLTTPTAAVTTYAYSYTATVPTDTVNPIAAPSNTTGWLTTTMTDPGNNVTTTVTDLAGRTYRSQEPNAGVSWFAYDANGNVTATKDAAYTPGASTVITTSYDALNRPVTRTDRNGQTATWAYDGATAGLGMPWKETSNQTGGTFVNTINKYTTRYQIAEQTYTIPGVFGTDLAAGDWRYQTWWTETGRPYQVSTPNQPVTVGSTSWPTSQDTVRYSYDVYGNVLGAGEPVNATLPAANGLNLDPSKLYVNTDTLTGDGLDDLGRVTARLLERSSSEVGMLREYTYNTQTGAIDRIVGRWEALSGGFQDATYTRDAVGNVTTITDAVTATKECFLYDTRNRLIRAHTAATSSACATDPTAAFTGSRGSDPYDLQWTFDSINRIDTKIDMLPAGAGTLDYQYGDSAHPHAVTGMTDAGGATLTNYGYSYNPVGAMASRKSNTAAADTLAYDPSQRLTSYDRATGTDETYQYWATNQRVVRQAGTQRTIYLPSLDITIQGATLTITKQITAGAVVATKTIAGATTSIYWNCADLQDSTTCQTPAGTAPATPTIRHYNPYGTPRNTNTHPNTTRGYLNQPEDPTGLTYLNNRYHDPTLAAFVSVDPLVGKTGTPYLYGNGTPVTLSDPSGLDPDTNAQIRDRLRKDSGEGAAGPVAAPCDSSCSPLSPWVEGTHPDHQPGGCSSQPECVDQPNPAATGSTCTSANRCYDDSSGMGTNQAAFCGWPSRWKMCVEIYGYRDQAYEKMEYYAELLGWTPGQRNAFRHAYGTALIAWNYGSSTAVEFTNRHEQDTPKATLWEQWDSDTDIWNNSIGVGLVDRAKSFTYAARPGQDVDQIDFADIEAQLVAMATCECAGSFDSRLLLAAPISPSSFTVDKFGQVTYLALDTEIQSG